MNNRFRNYNKIMCGWSSSATTLNIKLVRNIMQFFGQVYILHNLRKGKYNVKN